MQLSSACAQPPTRSRNYFIYLFYCLINVEETSVLPALRRAGGTITSYVVRFLDDCWEQRCVVRDAVHRGGRLHAPSQRSSTRVPGRVGRVPQVPRRFGCAKMTTRNATRTSRLLLKLRETVRRRERWPPCVTLFISPTVYTLSFILFLEIGCRGACRRRLGFLQQLRA